MPSLFLCAGDPCWTPPDRTDFIQLLRTLGLLDQPLQGGSGDDSFGAGERVPSLIIFLGCSPRIVLNEQQAGDGETACFVRLHCYPQVHFIGAPPSGRVRCPACRKPAHPAPEGAHDTPFHCTGCGATFPFSALDWRHSAGFGRCFVEVTGVWPHEAVPADGLMEALQAYSHTAWRYFYTD